MSKKEPPVVPFWIATVGGTTAHTHRPIERMRTCDLDKYRRVVTVKIPAPSSIPGAPENPVQPLNLEYPSVIQIAAMRKSTSDPALAPTDSFLPAHPFLTSSQPAQGVFVATAASLQGRDFLVVVDDRDDRDLPGGSTFPRAEAYKTFLDKKTHGMDFECKRYLEVADDDWLLVDNRPGDIDTAWPFAVEEQSFTEYFEVLRIPIELTDLRWRKLCPELPNPSPVGQALTVDSVEGRLGFVQHGSLLLLSLIHI